MVGVIAACGIVSVVTSVKPLKIFVRLSFCVAELPDVSEPFLEK